jgi:trimethylamine:corrinoid methyltransferase-like protein
LEDANVQIELAALVAGGRDALKKRPLMSVISCPIAPLAFDAVEKIGQGHHFLASKHTTRYMREETTQWDADKLKMLSADAATLASESRKIVEQLLKEHRIQPIDANLIRQGNEIIRAYEGKLAG